MRRFNGFTTFLTQLKEVLLHKPQRPRKGISRPKKARPPISIPRLALSVGLDLLALASFFIILLALMSPLLAKAGYAPGSDTPSHMYVTQRLAEGLRATGSLPKIDLFWYSGLEITHKLPPLPYLPMVIIYLLTNKAMLTSRVFLIVVLGLMGLSMYAAIRFRRPRLNALGAAVLVTFSPIVFSYYFGVLGSFTRFFAFLWFPLALYCAERLLDGRRQHLALLALVISLILTSHPMVGLVAILWIGVYAGFRLLLERRSILEIRYFVYAVGLAFLLTTWYVVPYLFEEPVWGGSIPQEALAFASIPLWAQWRRLGLIFGLSAVAAISLRFSRPRLALVLATLFGFTYALGIHGPLVRLAPALKFAYPSLAYYASIIGLIYLIFNSASIGEITGDGLKRYLKQAGAGAGVLILVAGVVYQSYLFTEFTRVNNRQFTGDEIAVNVQLRRQRLPGRVMPLNTNYGLIVQALPLLGKKSSPEGQYTVIAPFYLEITKIYDDIKKGYLITARQKLRRWNVAFVLLMHNLKQRKDFRGRSLRQVLKEGGFKQIYQNASFTLYKKSHPPGYVQPVNEEALVVGRFAPVFSALYPDSISSQKSNYIDDYTLDDLKDFRVLVLYGFSYRNQAAAEKLLKAYVRQGGSILIDMQALDEFTYARNKVFFNVKVGRKKRIGTLHFKTRQPNQLGLPDLKPVKIPSDWTVLYYRNLDRTLVEASAKRGKFPVVGYKEVGKGKVYFIGTNLLFYGFEKRRQDVIAVVNKLLAGPEIKRLPPVMADISVRRFAPERMVFTYRADRAWPALISRTYSPHWRASLPGGRRLNVIKTEGLMQINLPKGRHKVTLWYGPTLIHLAAKIIAALAWVIVIILFFKARKIQAPSAADAGGKDVV